MNSDIVSYLQDLRIFNRKHKLLLDKVSRINLNRHLCLLSERTACLLAVLAMSTETLGAQKVTVESIMSDWLRLHQRCLSFCQWLLIFLL